LEERAAVAAGEVAAPHPIYEEDIAREEGIPDEIARPSRSVARSEEGLHSRDLSDRTLFRERRGSGHTGEFEGVDPNPCARGANQIGEGRHVVRMGVGQKNLGESHSSSGAERQDGDRPEGRFHAPSRAALGIEKAIGPVGIAAHVQG
jgi:hypothetical protein